MNKEEENKREKSVDKKEARTDAKKRKSNPKKKLLLLIPIVLVTLVLIGLVLYLDFSGEHVIIRLGRYKGLTVEAGGRSAEEAILDAIIDKTSFGRKLKFEVEEKYKDSMQVFEEEAKYYGLSLAGYLDRYYGMDEDAFRREVRSTTEITVRQSAVLHAVAEKEKIEFTEAELDAAVPIIMKEYGYTDERQFYQEIDITSIRNELLEQKVIEFLLKENTVK